MKRGSQCHITLVLFALLQIIDSFSNNLLNKPSKDSIQTSWRKGHKTMRKNSGSRDMLKVSAGLVFTGQNLSIHEAKSIILACELELKSIQVQSRPEQGHGINSNAEEFEVGNKVLMLGWRQPSLSVIDLGEILVWTTCLSEDLLFQPLHVTQSCQNLYLQLERIPPKRMNTCSLHCIFPKKCVFGNISIQFQKHVQ